MANTEDNVLPILVQYAADKVRSSEVFLRLHEKFYYHLQSGNLEFITIRQRLQIHFVLEVPVPEQLRHPQAKFNENGRLLEFSGELQLGDPKI